MLPDPDFTQTCFPKIEAKLNRKLTAEENRRFYFCYGAMRKEWFYDRLNKCLTTDAAEKLLAYGHLSVGSKPKISVLSKLRHLLFGK